MRQLLVGVMILLIVPVVGRGDDEPRRSAPAPLPTIPIAPTKKDPAEGETNPAWKKAASGTPADDPAKPPDPKKLKEDLEKLLREREELAKGAGSAATDDERTKLKKQLDDLILKLEKPKTKPKVEEKKPDPHKAEAAPDGKLIDPMRYGLIKYQEGDFKAALAAFRLADPNVQNAEEKAFTRYLIACCHKQLGQTNEAIKLYQEITEAKLDSFVTECALSQLSTIRQLRELDAQLEQLRVRRKAK